MYVADQPAVATEYTKEQDIEIAASYEGPRLLASGTESPLSQQKKVQRPNREQTFNDAIIHVSFTRFQRFAQTMEQVAARISRRF